MLSPAAAPALAADFPRYRGAGFFPHADADCGPAVNALVAEVTAPAFADAIGARLGIERLSQHPTLVTLCRALNRRHGTIHTDSRSKVATALVYLSPSWPEISAGCLRFLARSDDIESVLVPELQPLYGRLAAFKRADNSFHGHLPFEGERPVIQIAWLVDAAARDRKTRRGRFSRALKWLAGRLDGWFGRGRGDNAGHLD
ncbi:MAG: 2OG-Fe(II) oxygenase [Rhodanobacteraceae bacterium]|nr:2OG-Fe(II) oxygenase [Rhodanobacteraceae bacterium]